MKTAEQRPILCEVDKVASDSLPYSLRHSHKGECLEDARALLCLLKEICWSGTSSDFIFNGWRGMGLVLDLIRDKVDIANSDYHFPLSGCSDDLALVERTED